MRLRNGPVVALAVFALAGCGVGGSDDGDRVASANGAGAAAPPSGTPGDNRGTEENMLAFAKCMRDHGVDMPDPEIGDGGGVEMVIPRGADRGEVDAAREACRRYAPDGGELPKASPGMLEQARKMSRCMREHGLPRFPDPDESGGIRIESGQGLDPGSAEFKAAEQACQEFGPKGAGEPRTDKDGG
ncbi:hypothetical protein V5P93_003212 [Actinokineospora auranticolor]|uniref:Uncharacterized protein n=1 Tax=Actinokineospora auranticolor TaxID=155976 RepID=A0A2S6H1Q3_9PSEU|nr:hypothetical protein [Actinokineospora auranticolor]PPK71346.1 hypothetical protein CLV40_101536 [Actinokineospora auranticolor]